MGGLVLGNCASNVQPTTTPIGEQNEGSVNHKHVWKRPQLLKSPVNNIDSATATILYAEPPRGIISPHTLSSHVNGAHALNAASPLVGKVFTFPPKGTKW